MLLSLARSKKFAARQLIYVITTLFFLVEGCAKITQLTRSGEEVVLRIATRGQLVGELGYMPGSMHGTTARALHESDVLAWPTDAFSSALLWGPILQKNVDSILGKRISEMEGRRRECLSGLANGFCRQVRVREGWT